MLIMLYTQPTKAPVLLDACKQLKLDNPFLNIAFVGDFNVHSPDWICSTCDADKGGVMAQEICELFGLQKIVDFPTRGDNTLDLVMATNAGEAIPKPGRGTSDHKKHIN